jgi:hypothetical protein
VTAGKAGETANKALAFGGSFIDPEITVDAKGRVTALAARTITLPAAPASVSGNAGTATKLATARTINGVSFDGTTNITVADSAKLPLAGGTMTGDIKYSISGKTTSARIPLQLLLGDANGDGVILGNSGGLVALSAGEAFATYQNNASTKLVGHSEEVQLLTDGGVTFVTGLQTFANRGSIRVTNDGVFPYTTESTRAQNLGSSAAKWNNVYATTFIGALTGKPSITARRFEIVSNFRVAFRVAFLSNRCF